MEVDQRRQDGQTSQTGQTCQTGQACRKAGKSKGTGGYQKRREARRQQRIKRVAGLVVLMVLVSIGAFKLGAYLPDIGDPNSPANTYVSDYYLENGDRETNAPNIVTAVLADYRGFDTLFETCVLFLSGLSALLILSPRETMPVQHLQLRMHIQDEADKPAKKIRRKVSRTRGFGSSVMDTTFRLIIPALCIYAFYVLFHGEVSLGGGFQAGALLACAYLLDRIIVEFESRMVQIPKDAALVMAGVGVAIYGGTGILALLGGENYLDYDGLGFGLFPAGAGLHGLGILMIETGVTVAVLGVITGILEVILERADFDV